MSPFAMLVVIRVKEVGRSASGLALHVAAPLVLLGTTGALFARGHPFERRTVAVVGPAAALAPLEGMSDVDARQVDEEPRARAQLMQASVNAVLIPGAPGRLLVGPNEQLFGRGLAGALGGGVQLEVLPVPRWAYMHFLFPGLLTWLILASGLYGMGYGMARYRHALFLKKLATTPLPRTTFVAAQIAARAVVVFAQMVLMVGVAWLAFDLPLTAGQGAALAALSMLGLLTFMGVGFVLASMVKDESNLLDAITVLLTLLVFLSEVFFPVASLPAPLPSISAILPSTQLARLMRSVLQGEHQPAALAPGLAVLLIWGVVAYAVAVASFRWLDD